MKEFINDLISRVTYFVGWCGFWTVYGLFHRYRVHRRDRKAALKGRTRGLLLAVNHNSFIDPSVAGIAFFHRVWFLARRSLFDNPCFAWLITAVCAMPISREKLDLATLRQVRDCLDRGRYVMIFPEGTRSETGELQKGQAGVGFFADKLKADVLPIYIQGAFESWPKGGKYHFAKLDSIIGDVIPYESWENLPAGRERYQLMADGIMERLAALRDELKEIKEGR